MAGNKVPLPGSERRPVGTRVGDVPKDEVIEVSVILKPKPPIEAPQTGGAAISREEFAARYGADPGAIDQLKAFAKQYSLTVTEVASERRTVKLEGTAADMSKAFDVPFELALPRMGTVMVAGPLGGWIAAAVENDAVFGGFSALGAALYSLGIAKGAALRYEAAVQAGRILAIAHGAAGELGKAREILAASAPTSE